MMIANGLGMVNITVLGSLGDLAVIPNEDAENPDKNKKKPRKDAVQNSTGMERQGERDKKRKKKKTNPLSGSLKGPILV